MGMVFCRACGKELHETAPACPHCGALQMIPHAPVATQESADGFFAYAFEPLKKYANFKGRARRKEYWYFFLFLLALNFVIGFMSGLLNSSGLYMLPVLITFGTLIPSIAVGVRRMHDIDRSGWWLLLPIVNLIFICQDSHQGDNRFGASPKYPQ